MDVECRGTGGVWGISGLNIIPPVSKVLVCFLGNTLIEIIKAIVSRWLHKFACKHLRIHWAGIVDLIDPEYSLFITFLLSRRGGAPTNSLLGDITDAKIAHACEDVLRVTQ